MTPPARTPPLDRLASAVVLWLVAWVRPRWAVEQQHRQNLGIVWAWAVAAVSVAWVVVVLPALTLWTQGLANGSLNSPLPYILNDVSEALRLLRNVVSHPPDLARLVAVILVGHGLWVVVAWVHLGWCARPGTPFDALQQSMRTIAWASPAGVWVMTAVTLAVVFWDESVGVWLQTSHHTALTYTGLSTDPWWVTFSTEGQLLVITTGLLLGYAWLTAAIRAMPWPARCVWPPRCTGCGYALHGVDPKGPCPECGQPVPQSLSPKPLHPHPAGGRFPAFTNGLRYGRAALMHPKRLGRATPLYTLNPHHAASRWITGIAQFLTALLGVAGLHIVFNSYDPGNARWLGTREGIVWAYAVLPTLLTLISLVTMQVTSTLAASSYTRKDAGTTFPAAAALASFAGPLLVVGQALLWVVLWVLVIVGYAYTPTHWIPDSLTFTYRELCIVVMTFLTLVSWWAGYSHLIGRALRAARFNNH
ncbi:MAG: hypothetical protein AAGI68_03820 [Planctomycetota bacterium]